ncbi:MAG: hypothetical protein JSV77_08170 [Dehalococcoidales bacterium]|nr:MAG: hypothetical protein JSV77_08170 [Dehalococcoidales bacterium]
MKRYITSVSLTAVILTFICASICGCAQSNSDVIENSRSDSDVIENTITRFFNEWIDSDFSECLNCWADSTRADRGDSEIVQLMYQCRLMNVGDYSTATLHSIDEPMITGSTARTWFKSENEGGLIMTAVLTLIKRDEHWWITEMMPYFQYNTENQ